MRCCVTGCKNDSRYSSKSQGITFHVFPVEPSLRSAWLRALGMETWEPGMERSAVCSEHFLRDDLYEPKKGLRRTVRPGAVPSIIQDSDNCEYGDPDSLKFCRICLVVESKLFPMRKYMLEQAYENLTGVSACSERSKLPQKLCAECAQRLVNCARFRSKSLRANSLLTEVVRKQGEITPKNLKTINRKKNQLQSSLESKIYEPDHYDLSHYDDTEIKESSQMTETDEIKNENVINEIFQNEFDDEILELPIEAREEETIDLKAIPEIKNENDCFTIENYDDIVNSEIDENHSNIDSEDYIANESSTDDELPKGIIRNFNSMPKTKNENGVITIENDNDKANSKMGESHGNIDDEDYIANSSFTDDELPKVPRSLKFIPKTKNKNDFFTIRNGNDKVNSEIDENHDNIDDEDYIANESSTDDELPRGVLQNMKAIPKVKNRNNIITIENANDKVNSEIEENNDSIDDIDFIANESSTDDELPKGVLWNRSRERKSKKREISKIKKTKTGRREKSLSDIITISNLTYEEQVAEIAKRKEGSMYKNAGFKCNDCFRGFVYEDTYNAHMSRHTNESGEYRCDVCKTHFKHPYVLRKHIAAHHAQRFTCKKCPFTTTHRQNAKQHDMFHKGTKYSCPHCPEEFIKITSYMGHIRIKHPSDFVCQLCGYSFVSERGIFFHKMLKHRQDKDIEIPEDGPNCEKCNIRFINSAALTRHISVSDRHTDLERTKRAPNTRKPGEVLGEGDPRPKVKKRKLYPRRDEWPISCEQCGVQLNNSRAYNRHFRQVHPDQNRTKYPSMKTPHMCEICGRFFPSFAVLKDHSITHTGERPFSCEDCGKSFQMKTRLDGHRKVHSPEKSTHQCQVCLKHFSTRGNLRKHMLIHSGLKPFKCEVCGKSFMFLYEKRDHIAYVHYKKPWPKRIRGKRRVDPKQNKTPENMPKNR